MHPVKQALCVAIACLVATIAYTVWDDATWGLHLITPCSRPENLHTIAASIDFSKIRTWYIVYDTNRVPFVKRFEGHPKVVELACNLPGSMGNMQRNMALDAIAKGMVYFVDDDNTVHPHFWALCDRFKRNKIYTFNYERDGAVLKGDTPVVGAIDTSQYVFDIHLARGVRFDPHRYEADGVFIEQLVAAHPDKWEFVDEVAAVYNNLQKK